MEILGGDRPTPDDDEGSIEEVAMMFAKLVRSHLSIVGSTLSQFNPKGEALMVQSVNADNLEERWCVVLATNQVATDVIKATQRALVKAGGGKLGEDDDDDEPPPRLISLN